RGCCKAITLTENRPEFRSRVKTRNRDVTTAITWLPKAKVDPYDCLMKATLAVLLLCAIPAFSQSSNSDSSKCLPQTLGPFAFGGAARPETDEYLYPRYFRYVKQWDKCIAHGKWPAAKIEQFPEAYPSSLNGDQRKFVTREAYEWDLAPLEATLT